MTCVELGRLNAGFSDDDSPKRPNETLQHSESTPNDTLQRSESTLHARKLARVSGLVLCKRSQACPWLCNVPYISSKHELEKVA